MKILREFPNFKDIELSDKAYINRHVVMVLEYESKDDDMSIE